MKDLTPLEEMVSIEKWLEDLKTTPEELLKDKKNEFLNKKIVLEHEGRTTYSGAWGVPSFHSVNKFYISESPLDELSVKEKIKELKKEEKIRLKNQRSKEHDYRFQRSDDLYKSWEITTLKKVLKNWNKREKDSHGVFGSSSHKYILYKKTF